VSLAVAAPEGASLTPVTLTRTLTAVVSAPAPPSLPPPSTRVSEIERVSVDGSTVFELL
jgi:hypothetical protein